MKIVKIEHSPMPQWTSVVSTRLQFNKAEWNTLVRAKKILDAAETKLAKYYIKQYGLSDDTALSDVDFDLSQLLPYHYIDELLDQHGYEGLRL